MISAIILSLVLHTAPVDVLNVPTGAPIRYERITSMFGWRKMDAKFHTGMDMSAVVGTPVQATASGKVVFVGESGGYGLLVIVDHGNGISTWFAHLSQALIKIGSKVKKGQVFAKVGNSGKTTGPHLHFEIRVNGQPVDPAAFVLGEDE